MDVLFSVIVIKDSILDVSSQEIQAVITFSLLTVVKVGLLSLYHLLS